ncbi:membrane or secreted protein [Spirosoma areae]
MKNLFVVLLFLSTGLVAASFRPRQLNKIGGAWRLVEPSRATVLLTLTDDYLIQTVYEPNRYISTRGGAYRQDSDKLNVTVEFDTQDSSRVGQTEAYRISLNNGQLYLTGVAGNRPFSRIVETKTPLTGLWRITGRANDAGQITTMQRGPRKTIKLLTGSRFQWVAINPQTKQFFGTGGGTYSLNAGKYTETIDFFSRDNSRVGRSLTFGADVTESEWRHTGQSSAGSPISEVWSREKN